MNRLHDSESKRIRNHNIQDPPAAKRRVAGFAHVVSIDNAARILCDVAAIAPTWYKNCGAWRHRDTARLTK
jgi:hypothetical protein